MIKKLTTIFAVALLFVATSNAQWVNQGAWPDAELLGQMHGVAVDPDGKVWAGNFGPERYNLPGTTDTVTAGLLRVFNPDGTPAAFSPVWGGTLDGVADTNTSNIRGMATDHEGNIIMVDGQRWMRRFNYQTGELMNKVRLQMTTSPVAPGVATETGNIFVGPVVNADQPIEEYTADFSFVGVAVQLTQSGFTRAMEVSADGNTIYFPIYSIDRTIVYQRADEFSSFDSVGTIMDGAAPESIAWNDATGHLWVSAGSFNDTPDSTEYPWTPNTWYAWDPATEQIVDSLSWTIINPEAPAAERPRAIDFSPDGMIAYIGAFGGPGYPLIQKVVNMGVGIAPEPNFTANEYSLTQNYPNPFNPSTEIQFTVKDAGLVTLKVYDILGKEVATLVNENLDNGLYSINFNASKLSSGTYIYQLTVNGTQLSKKMLLMK
jgi:hypothetical protein